MEPPIVWFEFCDYFHQDFMLVYGTLEEAVEAFKESATPEATNELSDFIQGKIKSELSENQLQKNWRDCGAQVEIIQISMRDFFSKVVALLS